MLNINVFTCFSHTFSPDGQLFEALCIRVPIYLYLHMLVHLSLFYFTQRSLLDDDLEDMESESEEEEERQVQWIFFSHSVLLFHVRIDFKITRRHACLLIACRISCRKGFKKATFEEIGLR